MRLPKTGVGRLIFIQVGLLLLFSFALLAIVAYMWEEAPVAILSLVAVLAGAVCTGIVFYFSKQLFASQKDIETALCLAAKGDYSSDLAPCNLQEMEELRQAANELIQDMARRSDTLQAIAQGDLLVDIPLTSPNDRCGQAMKDMTELILSLVDVVGVGTEEIRKGRLDARVDLSSFPGGWSEVFGTVNQLADTFNGYLRSLPDPLIIIDPTYHIQFANQAAHRLLGKEEGQLIGSLCHDHFRTDACGKEACACRSCMESKNAVTRETHATLGGQPLDFRYTGVPLQDDYGQVIGAMEVFVDITESKQGAVMMEKTAMFTANEVQNLIEQLQQLSAGDLRMTYDVAAGDEDTALMQEQFVQVASHFNDAVTSIHDTLRQVIDGTGQASEAFAQIASSSQVVAEGASEQAGAIEQTSSSLEEMAATVKQTAEHVQEANGVAQMAMAAAEEGGAAVGNMGQSMHKIREAADATSAIIRDINEIAFQTNLLALNAAVEAARAGEAGRGFAVVAEEVRNLALRSKEAAKRTEDLISESVNLSESGGRYSEELEQALNLVIDSIRNVAALIDEVTTASKENSIGIDQVTRAIAEMEKVTQQTAAASEQSSSASQDAMEFMRQLQSMLERFKIEGGYTGQPMEGYGKDTNDKRRYDDSAVVPVKKQVEPFQLSAEDVIPLDSDPDFKNF